MKSYTAHFQKEECINYIIIDWTNTKICDGGNDPNEAYEIAKIKAKELKKNVSVLNVLNDEIVGDVHFNE
jgi:hypothetical protein